MVNKIIKNWKKILRTSPYILYRQLKKQLRAKKILIDEIRKLIICKSFLETNIINNSSFYNIKNKRRFLFLSRKELEDNLQDLDEMQKRKMLGNANKILEHKINLLGSREIDLSNKINWRQDYKSGRVWPLEYFSNITINYKDGSDIKMPWELSRFYHLPILTAAFLLTNNNKYSDEAVTQIENWIDENPVYFGPNWACPMETAIRICNWMWFWTYLKEDINDEIFIVKFLNSVYFHGKYIYENLEYGYFTSNHYLSDIVGLIFIGILFPEFKESKKWLKHGVKAIEKEMEKQISEEGVDFEASTSYHRLVLELFLYTSLLCDRNNIKLSNNFWRQLEKMFDFVMYELKPNGEIPQFGDNDNGRVFILDEYYNWKVLDHRYLLSIGSVMFNRVDFKYGTCNHDSYLPWLFSKKDLQKYRKFSSQPKDNVIMKFYKKSGYLFVKNKEVYFAANFTGNGGKNEMGGHGHNDFGNFELSIMGHDFIIDPGTGNYTGNSKLRNQLRSQKYHNGLMINNLEFNNFYEEELFHYRETFKPELIKFEDKDDIVKIELFNTAYKKKLNINYSRIFEINLNKRELFINDFLDNLDNKEFNLRFSLNVAPNCKIARKNNNSVRTDLGLIEFDKRLGIEIEKSIYSSYYGLNIKSNKIVSKSVCKNNTKVSFLTKIFFSINHMLV